MNCDTLFGSPVSWKPVGDDMRYSRCVNLLASMGNCWPVLPIGTACPPDVGCSPDSSRKRRAPAPAVVPLNRPFANVGFVQFDGGKSFPNSHQPTSVRW